MGRHVLVVEADTCARDLLSAVLAYSGAAVTQATSAGAAVDLARRNLLDVMVTDVTVPAAAVGLVRQLRSLDHHSLPVIALIDGTSGLPLAAEFDAHLCKPVDPWELVRMIAELTRKA